MVDYSIELDYTEGSTRLGLLEHAVQKKHRSQFSSVEVAKLLVA